MRVALVELKASFKTFIFVIFLHCLIFYNFAEAQSKPDISDARIARKTCILKPDPGPCRGNLVMFYFDPKKGECKRFVWGGCQGNGNRFDSRDECYSNCLQNLTSLAKTRPRYCDLNFDYGYCFGAIQRYYYDHLWKVCKEMLYSGCGGNKNNFYNIEQCDLICRYGNGFIKSINMKKGKIRKVIVVNPPEALTTKKAHRVQTKKATGVAAVKT